MADKEIDRKDATALKRAFGKYAQPGDFGFHLKEVARTKYTGQSGAKSWTAGVAGLALGIPMVIAGHSVDTEYSYSSYKEPLSEDTQISTVLEAEEGYSIVAFKYDDERYALVRQGDGYRLFKQSPFGLTDRLFFF